MEKIIMTISGINKDVKAFNAHIAECGFTTVEEMICSLSTPALRNNLIKSYEDKFKVRIGFSSNTSCACRKMSAPV